MCGFYDIISEQRKEGTDEVKGSIFEKCFRIEVKDNITVE